MLRKTTVLGLSYFVWMAAMALALDPKRAVTQYGHDNWQSAQGLPQNTVQSIAQTSDGYLWIGTQEGLARFDGVRFLVYTRRNTPELPNQDIRALAAIPGGGLWIGTEDGLILYRDGRFRRYTRKDGLPSNHVLSLALDKQETLWLGMRGGGLSRLAAGKFEAFPKESFAKGNIWSLVAASKGDIWVGSSTGLYRYHDGRFQKFTTADGLPDNLISGLAEDREGTLWVGTNRGLGRFQEGAFSAAADARIAVEPVRTVRADRAGNIWVGTPGNGLFRVNGDKSAALLQGPGLTANYIATLFEDREGSLWIGTQGGGLDRLKDTKILPVGAPEGVTGQSGWLVLQRREGGMLLVTEKGLSRADEHGITPVISNSELGHSSISSMVEDHDGAVWIGCQDGTILKLVNGRFQAIGKQPPASQDIPMVIFEDRAQQIWVGTTGGLMRLDGQEWRIFKTKDGLSHNYVRAIVQDSEGALWLGTFGGGVTRLQDGKFRIINKAAGLSSDLVESLLLARDETLWIGTADAGLNALRNGKIVPLTSQAGLYDDRAFQILEDRSGALWVGCNRGIYSVSKAVLERFLKGETKSVQTVQYGEADGMRSAECNGGAQPAGWVGRDGRLWFPTVKGFSVVDTQQMTRNALVPPVAIEEARLDGAASRPGATSADLRVPAEARSLEVDYAALSFLAPQTTAFRYRLEGLQNEWVEAGNRRTAYYTNLPPGKYRFHVIAANNDGVWNREGASIGILVEPHFYQTSWFVLLSLAGILGVLWIAYTFRVRQLQMSHQAVLEERARMARDLHDTLLQGFAGVAMQLEAVSRRMRHSPADGEPAAGLLEGVLVKVDRCLADARESVWDLRSPLLEGNDLGDALRQVCRDASSESVIVGFLQTGNARPVPLGIAQQLLRIVQEALSNAMRHSGGHKVTVAAVYLAKELTVSVEDNGVGLAADSPKSGHWGLKGIGERVQRVGGCLQVASEPGQGTRIAVTVPIP